MGIVERSANGFGLEAAGIVLRTGPEVKDLKVGDRVVLMGHCAFATRVTTSEQLCAKMPDDLSFDDGATMPSVYTTSIYSIFNVGNLRKGQVSNIQLISGGLLLKLASRYLSIVPVAVWVSHQSNLRRWLEPKYMLLLATTRKWII